MSATRVSIIEGSTSCGKTAYALDAYRQCVVDHGCDTALVLVPTGRVGDLARGRLWHEGLPGMFDFRVLTFAALADALLVANHVPVAAVNDLQQQYLVARALAQMSDDDLGPLAAQRERPGLVASLTGLINEMKAAGVPHETLAAALSRGAGPVERAGAKVYARYQQLLHAYKLYDAAGMLWQAHDTLSEGKRRPFDRTKLVVADGFSDFTTMQLRVLAELARIADRTILTLTCEPGDDRPELQHVPARTRAALVDHLSPVGEIEHVTLACPPTPGSDLGHLRAHLFDPAAPARPDRDGTVRILRGPGVWAEVRLAARQIKRLLTAGDGTKPTDIAIVVRSLDTYQAALRGIFDEYDLPLFVAGGEPSARRGCVRLVADLLRLVEEDFPRAATVAVLDSTFHAHGLGDATSAEVDEVARKAGIVGGRDLWLKALDRLERRTRVRLDRTRAAEDAGAEPADDDEDERPPSLAEDEALLDHLARVRTTFAALADLLSPLGRAGTRRDFAAALLRVLADLGVGESVAERGRGRQGAAELRAWDALIDALERLGDVDALLGGGEVEPATFAAEARHVLGALRSTPSGRGEGRVVALGVHDALQSAYDHVFLLGLTEGSFPLRAASDPLLPDDRRRALEAAGLAVRPRKSGQDEEAYLFHLALTRARENLYLCYPDTDAGGEQLLRSYYVNDVVRLLPNVDEEPWGLAMKLRDVIPPMNHAAGARELAERAMLRKYGEGDDAESALGMLARGWSAEVVESAGKGARIELVRAGKRTNSTPNSGNKAGPFGPYDGVLGRTDVIAALEQRFGPDHFWSASQLGSYGSCPIGFFFQRVLGLEELEEPEHEVTAMEQGLLLHRILAGFYRKRVESGLGHIANDDALDAAAAMLRAAEDAGFEWYERSGLTGNEALWEVTKEVVRARLSAWLEAETQIPDKLKAGALEPSLFEYAYDPEHGNALVLDLPLAGPAVVRGRIDRLDLVGDDGFVVFDYKRGGAPSKRAIEDGADFQLAFYAMVGERLAASDRLCAGWAYVRVGMPIDKALEGKVVGEDDAAGLMKLAEGNAEHHILMMRQGYFAWPEKCESGRFCPFGGICRWEPRRGRIRQRAQGELADDA